MTDKCKYCKNVIEGNPQFVLQRMSLTGYDDSDFCNLEHLLKYILKKYKGKLRRMGY